ncbi:MAG: hypothetical protein WBZ37_26040 [Mycobacterium sp.]
MNLTPLQVLNLANDLSGQHLLIAGPPGESGTLRVAAASFAETYMCPDPTCHPELEITTGGPINSITIRHDDWCSELHRRSAKTDTRRGRRKGKGKR